jgi:cytochrome c oxidase subunit II
MSKKSAGLLSGGTAWAIGFALVALSLCAEAAFAGMGQPSPAQMGLQGAATPVAVEINRFHDYVNIIIIAITVFVLILLAVLVIRFNEKSNPTPSKTTHNTMLEVAWTVIPIFILIAIAIPSFKLLFYQYSFPKPDITIKAIGNAWFWEHEYPDHGNIRVTSNMITDEDLLKAKIGEAEFDKTYSKVDGIVRVRMIQNAAAPLWAENKLVRQLAVDNEIAVPVGKVIQLLITSNDVIHSWTVPSFGSKMQAVPGRVTATWFQPTQIGTYYGQCSVLCGKNHSGMPIAVRVVSDAAFANWTAAAKAKDWKKARGILQAATEGTELHKFAELVPAAE